MILPCWVNVGKCPSFQTSEYQFVHCKSGECQQRGHHSDFAAARDAIASRIEIPKQAIYAKEPFDVQFVKVQAALTRAER